MKDGGSTKMQPDRNQEKRQSGTKTPIKMITHTKLYRAGILW